MREEIVSRVLVGKSLEFWDLAFSKKKNGMGDREDKGVKEGESRPERWENRLYIYIKSRIYFFLFVWLSFIFIFYYLGQLSSKAPHYGNLFGLLLLQLLWKLPETWLV